MRDYGYNRVVLTSLNNLRMHAALNGWKGKTGEVKSVFNTMQVIIEPYSGCVYTVTKTGPVSNRPRLFNERAKMYDCISIEASSEQEKIDIFNFISGKPHLITGKNNGNQE